MANRSRMKLIVQRKIEAAEMFVLDGNVKTAKRTNIETYILQKDFTAFTFSS